MFGYVVRRIAATIPVMALVALFVFSLLYLSPGDPAEIIAGDQARPEDVQRVRASLGLDRPMIVQFADWTWRVAQGDLGRSIFTNQPVSHMIAQRVESTVSLLVLTLTLSIVIAVPMGVLAAWKHGTLIDSAVVVLAVLLAGSNAIWAVVVLGRSKPPALTVPASQAVEAPASQTTDAPVTAHQPPAREASPDLERISIPFAAAKHPAEELVKPGSRIDVLGVVRHQGQERALSEVVETSRRGGAFRRSRARRRR